MSHQRRITTLADPFVVFLLLSFAILLLHDKADAAISLFNETTTAMKPKTQSIAFSSHGSFLDHKNGTNSLTSSSLSAHRDVFGAFGNLRRSTHSVPPAEKEPTTNGTSVNHVPQRSLAGTVQCRVTSTFLGFGIDQNLNVSGIQSTPADPQGAAGVSRLVAVANSLIEVRHKNGTLIFRESLQKFFSLRNPIAASDTPNFFNPKVIYDGHTGRFVVAAIQQKESLEISRVWLAVSQGETPDTITDWLLSGFFNSAVTVDGVLTRADFLGVEADEKAVYVTANMIPFSDQVRVGVRLWILTKDGDALIESPPFDPYEREGNAVTTMPTQVHCTIGVDCPVGAFLSSVFIAPDRSVHLQVITLFFQRGTPPTFIVQTLDLGVRTQDVALPVAPQLGSASGLDIDTVQELDAVWQNNTSWTVFTINPTSGVDQGEATVHWVRCRFVGVNVTLEAQGSLGGNGNETTHTYVPSVAVNTEGVVAYGYSASSPSTHVGAFVTAEASDQSLTIQTGLAPYNRVSRDGRRNQWGGYSGISVDPTDDTFWVFNQFADTSNGEGRWGTVWGHVQCLPLPTPPPPPGTNSTACGLLGLSLFCPLTLCGLFGRWLGLCRT